MDKTKGFIVRMLNFDTMITPGIIKIIYALVTSLSMLMGLLITLNGATSRFGGGMQVIGGLLLIAASPFLIRVVCESMIVIFKINENLAYLRENNRNTY